MILRLAYLGVTNAFALLRLLPRSDRDNNAEILALRHQITVLQRHLGPQQIRFEPADRALLAALLHPLPRPTLRGLRLLVRPRHHPPLAPRPCRPPPRGCLPAQAAWPAPHLHSVRTLVLRLARENPSWGYRRVHGELLVLGVKVAPSTVWEILHENGIDPTAERSATTWAWALPRIRPPRG